MDENALVARVADMSEDERKALDPICEALTDYLTNTSTGGFSVPNRIVALACVDIAREYYRRAITRT